MDRLTLRYQLWRGMSQSMTHFRMKKLPLTPRLVATTAAIAAARALLGLLLLVLPVYGIGSLTIAIRSLGWAVGRIQAIRGRESRLYAFAAEQATQGEPVEEVVLKLPDGDSGDRRHSLHPVWRRAA
jgi:hypothetical protein